MRLGYALFFFLHNYIDGMMGELGYIEIFHGNCGFDQLRHVGGFKYVPS